MSQLFHFYWEGKERSVSVSHNEEGLSLHFVDPEIFDTLGGKVILVHRGADWDYFTAVTRNQLQTLSSIVKALESALGKNLKSLASSQDNVRL